MEKVTKKRAVALAREAKDKIATIISETRDLLNTTSSIVPDSKEKCEELFDEIIKSVFSPSSSMGHLVAFDKFETIFADAIGEALNEKSEEVKNIIDNFKEEQRELELFFRSASMEDAKDVSNLMPNAGIEIPKEALSLTYVPQPKNEENMKNSQQAENKPINDTQDVSEDKAYSVAYSASATSKEGVDIIIATSKEDAVRQVVKEVIDSLEIKIESVKEEDI